MSPLLNPSSSQLKSLGATALGIARPALFKTLRLSMMLTSLSPSSSYPDLDLDRHVCHSSAVQNGIHSFDHPSFQPRLCIRCPFCFALDDYLVVADEHRHCFRTLTSALPQHG
jgi:hypothetical protein